MTNKKEYNINTIFVDCFNTIIFRNVNKKQVFKNWAIELSEEYNIPWKIIYKTYKNTNFWMCFKKLFTSFTLQEPMDNVLQKIYLKLSKKYNLQDLSSFINFSTEIYIKKELDCFSVNTELINFLQKEKNNGKNIYLVSDFYCKSNIINNWFTSLKINNIFDNIFSSCDFNKEKATTKLYKELLKNLNLNSKNVIMYGDNLWSDILMARACGLHAKRIKNKKQRRIYEQN